MTEYQKVVGSMWKETFILNILGSFLIVQSASVMEPFSKKENGARWIFILTQKGSFYTLCYFVTKIDIIDIIPI